MVRLLCLAHGLNDKRRVVLEKDEDFKNMLRQQAEGKTSFHVLYCQDGTSHEYRNQGFHDVMKRMIRNILMNYTVTVEDFSFSRTATDQPEHRQQELAKLDNADVFFIRGTLGNPDGILSNIVTSPVHSEAVLKLQYKVLEHKIIYMGVCGGALLAGHTFNPRGRHPSSTGLGLLGRHVNVFYDSWQAPVRTNCIQINEVNYVLLDTVSGIAR